MPKTLKISFFILAGPLLAILLYLFLPKIAYGLNGESFELSAGGRITISMAGWLVLWWITEATSIYVTALLPLLILPLSGFQTFADTAKIYAHPIIFLALGGFVLAAALEKWDLHKRFANFVLRLTGPSPRQIIVGFMLASALLSMWISNTAACIIMLPVALGVIAKQGETKENTKNFSPCLLLAICYACSVGGMTTLVGTTTNMFFAAFMQSELNYEVGFGQWMLNTIPLMLVYLPLSWFLLTRFIFPIPKVSKKSQQHLLTRPSEIKMSRPQILTLMVFLLVAGSWMFSGQWKNTSGLSYLSNEVIAIIGILLLFTIPTGQTQDKFLLDWKFANQRIPWGVLLLIGGGLALAKAFSAFEVGQYLAMQLSFLQELPTFLVLFVSVALMVFLTEVTTNVASVTALSPIFAALAVAIGINPVQLMVPITVAASFAFMLPVATPPNAIVFGSGKIKNAEMIRAGLILNLLAILLIPIWSRFFTNF